jgi:hypothetical protein
VHHDGAKAAHRKAAHHLTLLADHVKAHIRGGLHLVPQKLQSSGARIHSTDRLQSDNEACYHGSNRFAKQQDQLTSYICKTVRQVYIMHLQNRQDQLTAREFRALKKRRGIALYDVADAQWRLREPHLVAKGIHDASDRVCLGMRREWAS